MNIVEGWNMYLDIQNLKNMHFNVSQISRRLDLSYLNISPEEMELVLEIQKKRKGGADENLDF